MLRYFQKTLALLFLYSSVSESTINIVSLYDLMQADPSITYQKNCEASYFSYPDFPVAAYGQYHPSKGVFAESFIVKVANGRVCSRLGFSLVWNNLVRELLPQNYPITTVLNFFNQMKVEQRVPTKVSGKVAVLAGIEPDCYGHWLGEFLGRFAMLEMQGVKYDWLYVPHDKKYMKETLALLGVDSAKIIQPEGKHFYIQADELIIPSLTARRIPAKGSLDFQPCSLATMYCPLWVINYLRNKLLPMAEQMVPERKFNSKVFISRKDAGQRRMNNEDDVFKLFEKKGYSRYCMSDLSCIEQVALFARAESIVAAHGSALTNLLFCKSSVCVYEIFQNQFDSTFWQISQLVGLKHHCITTQAYDSSKSVKIDTTIDVKSLQKSIAQLL